MELNDLRKKSATELDEHLSELRREIAQVKTLRSAKK